MSRVSEQRERAGDQSADELNRHENDDDPERPEKAISVRGMDVTVAEAMADFMPVTMPWGVIVRVIVLDIRVLVSHTTPRCWRRADANLPRNP
jgi:hypothetical protein